MTEHKSYTGIDYFRLIAAFLIVAIHTSPLTSLSSTGDFILTRVISRVAVPFFLMTSGFFLISRYQKNDGKLIAFLKKTARMYGVAIVIYLPINLYNNYFSMKPLLPNLIKDILIDGTLYHLWYLPAAMLGGIIAWYLVRKLHYKGAFIIASILYLIGMFGDSYYGISQSTGVLNHFYDLIFEVTDYTRNGLFFAPIFFVLGGYIADQRPQMSLKVSILGTIISFSLMLTEALFLHHFDLQRHDSMYVLLLPCMYFLFHTLLHFRGKRHVTSRTVSFIIYIIHPMMIVAVRLCAKILGLESLLINNSMIHFIGVATASAVFAIVVTTLWTKYAPKKKKHNADKDRAYIEIDLKNLEHNVKVMQEAMPSKCEVMAVVKSNAYGHGTFEIASHLAKIGVKAYAVATIDEGIALRKYGISGEILILGYTSPLRAKELRKYNLTQTLIDFDYAQALNDQNQSIKAHIKVDSGMHRLGFDYANAEEIVATFTMKNISVTGIFTHLCVSDSLTKHDVDFTNMQIERFNQLLKALEARGLQIPKLHIQSSYGLLNYPELECDYMRAGVSLYGVLSSFRDETKLSLPVKPVLALKSNIVLLRSIKKGDTVGYGCTFTATRDSLIAVIPIGYADGYPRNLSGKGHYVLVNGQKAPIAGRICMDQFAIDVTDIPCVSVGTTVTLLGKDGDEEISAEMIADCAESITNELLSRMGQRLKVICKK